MKSNLTENGRQGLGEYFHEILSRVIDRIKNRNDKADLPFFSDILNEITCGFPRGKVTVVSARPSHGKTVFMLQNAANLSLKGRNVLFLSLEDRKEDLVERVICQVSDNRNRDLKRGNYNHLDNDKLFEVFQNMEIVMDDSFGFNLPEIEKAYKSTIFQNNKLADIIFWDYLQMVDEAGLETYNNFLRSIKRFSLVNNLSFVIGCQQNRWSVSKDGSVSNAGAKGSGAIEEVSDLILLLYYPFNVNDFKGKFLDYPNFDNLEEKDQNEIWKKYLEISVSKNKTGEIRHKIPFKYLGEKYLFQPWSEENTCERSKNE
jgi:replicative DNA helicase